VTAPLDPQALTDALLVEHGGNRRAALVDARRRREAARKAGETASIGQWTAVAAALSLPPGSAPEAKPENPTFQARVAAKRRSRTASRKAAKAPPLDDMPRFAPSTRRPDGGIIVEVSSGDSPPASGPDGGIIVEVLSGDSPKDHFDAAASLEELSDRIWREDHPRVSCPPDAVPTEPTLAQWFSESSVDTRREAESCLNKCDFTNQPITRVPPGMESEVYPLDTIVPGWKLTASRWLSSAITEREPVPGTANTYQPVMRLRAVRAIETDKGWILLQVNLQTIHKAWLAARETQPDLRHPLGFLIRAWRARPRNVEYDAGDERGRILPSRIAMIPAGDRREGKLFLPAAHAGNLDAEGRQLVIPGFERPRSSPALPLALYHLGIGDRAPGREGAGAPLALRLFIEAVLAHPYGERDGSGAVALTTLLGELMRRLWPTQPARANNMPRLWAASAALDSPEARIPIPNPGGRSNSLWRVVDILSMPDRFDPATPVRIRVHLPDGAADGPIMPAALGAWGARSAAVYNGIINLAYAWHEPGRLRLPKGGRRKPGTPWLQIQDPRRYPDLTDDDLINLFFPAGANRPRRKLLADAHTALKVLASARGVRIEGRKLLPPPPSSLLLPPPKREPKKRN